MATVNEVVEALKGKIDSKEKLDALLKAWNINPRYIGSAAREEAGRRIPGRVYDMIEICATFAKSLPCEYVVGVPASRWWVVRESLRAAFGVYMEMPELNKIQQHQTFHMFIHPSLDDRMQVAYTPSIESGEQDKQRVTTLSKLLRQVYLTWSDDAFRDIEAEYRSNMSDECLLCPVGRSSLRTIAARRRA
jgi:hypothetical protein